MVYDVEFIRHMDGSPETPILDATRLVCDDVDTVGGH